MHDHPSACSRPGRRARCSRSSSDRISHWRSREPDSAYVRACPESDGMKPRTIATTCSLLSGSYECKEANREDDQVAHPSARPVWKPPGEYKKCQRQKDQHTQYVLGIKAETSALAILSLESAAFASIGRSFPARARTSARSSLHAFGAYCYRACRGVARGVADAQFPPCNAQLNRDLETASREDYGRLA